MKRALLILSIVLFAISSCEETGYQKPENLISEKKMAKILYDIHLAEAVYNKKKYSNDSITFTDHDIHFSILEKHGVEDTLFIESIIYYSGYPKIYERIYKKVIDQLVMQEEEFDKKEAVKIKPDEKAL